METNENSQKNTPKQDFDLDAALAEKFQQVEEDLNQYRTLGPVTEEPPKVDDMPKEESVPKNDFEIDVPLPISEPVQELPPKQKKSSSSESAPEETSKERKARYKFRRSMLITTRIGAVVRIFTIGVIFFGASIFLLVGSRPTESAEENRKLATFPSFSWNGIKDGSYMDDIMTYYEDTVPGRSFFKQLISTMQKYTGLQQEDGVAFYGDITQRKSVQAAEQLSEATSNTQHVAAASALTTTTTTTPVPTEPEEEPVEVGDGIVLVGNRAISVYGGSFSRGEAYAASLNAYQEELGKDIQVYSLVAPTAVSFYLPESYSSYTASEWDNIDHINENLKDVIPVDAYHALESHTDEDIYARTDHHWLPLGAYYAAEAFAKEADVPFAPLSDYTPTTLSGYLGSMYTFTKSAVLRENPEDFTYYTPKNHYTTQYYDTDFTNERDGNLMISLDNVEPVSWYLVFMGGDEKITHVKTDCTNHRTLVIVKDSYGNALVPYLTQSFTDIYVTDMRYFAVNAVSFMKEVGATDVLFAMNTFSATGGNSEYLESNRTQ